MWRRIILLIFFVSGNLYAQSALDNLTIIKHDLKSKRISSYDVSGGNRDRFENIKSGEKVNLCNIEGTGIINHIWITMSPRPPKLNRTNVIFRIYWDGLEYPSVESPIGPFFGQGWDESYNFSSLPLAAFPLEGNALVSYFKMPFKKGARIEIENQTDETIGAFYFYIDYVELDEPNPDAGYFHAWYNHEVTEPPEEGENEWGLISKDVGINPKGEDNYLIVNTMGKGHYIGVNYYVNCPTPIWYGEGDDMIFIDGDKYPTLHGTGTEDYFNSCWSPNEKYSHPYFGYARTPSNIRWLGRTHVYRFHIEDPVYFSKSLHFTIEHGHNNYLALELASVAYWYLDKPSKLKPIPNKKARELKPVINFLDIHRWRHEWRKNFDSDSLKWGNERIEQVD